MITLEEIQTAVDALPREQKQELLLFVAKRLRNERDGSLNLRESSVGTGADSATADKGQTASSAEVQSPDFVARAKAIWSENPRGHSLSELVSYGREGDS